MSIGIVIVHGPKASGKTRRAKELMRHYGCERIIDEWDGRAPLRDGDLALTNMEPPFSVDDARVVSIATAKQAICG